MQRAMEMSKKNKVRNPSVRGGWKVNPSTIQTIIVWDATCI
jgi:hypothetical protein